MGVLERVSQLLTANVNHLLDQAEDPEVMIKQLIRDMEESGVELRRETVAAVAREKRLEKQVSAAEELAREVERNAELALGRGDERLARQILAKKIQTLKSRDTLGEELAGARQLAAQLRADLVRMQNQTQLAHRKQDELIRRKRAAEAQLRTQQAARRSAEAMSAASGRLSDVHAGQTAFDGYTSAITAIESEAEAARELSAAEDDSELKLKKLIEESDVDGELERLKARVAGD
jgi:phage shock protein A